MQCWKRLWQLRLCQHQALLAAQLDAKRWKRVSATKKLVGNEYKTPRNRRRRQDSLLSRDKLLEDGWSVKVWHTLAGFQRLRDGVFMASVKEAKMLMAESVLAPINLNENGTEISVLVQDRNVCMQSRQPFLHQLGDTPVTYQSAAPQ